MYIFSFVMIKKGRRFFFFFCIFQLNNNLTELFLNLKKISVKEVWCHPVIVHPSIHPFFITTSPWLGVVGMLESIPAVSGWYTGVIHRVIHPCRANTERQPTVQAHAQTRSFLSQVWRGWSGICTILPQHHILLKSNLFVFKSLVHT